MPQYLSMTEEDCSSAAEAFEEVLDMLSTVKETPLEDLRESFETHVRVTTEKFRARAPLLADGDVRHADYILALQGVHDFVTQYAIHYVDHTDPRLAKLWRTLRSNSLNSAGDQQTVAESLATRLHTAEDQLDTVSSKLADATSQIEILRGQLQMANIDSNVKAGALADLKRRNSTLRLAPNTVVGSGSTTTTTTTPSTTGVEKGKGSGFGYNGGLTAPAYNGGGSGNYSPDGGQGQRGAINSPGKIAPAAGAGGGLEDLRMRLYAEQAEADAQTARSCSPNRIMPWDKSYKSVELEISSPSKGGRALGPGSRGVAATGSPKDRAAARSAVGSSTGGGGSGGVYGGQFASRSGSHDNSGSGSGEHRHNMHGLGGDASTPGHKYGSSHKWSQDQAQVVHCTALYDV